MQFHVPQFIDVEDKIFGPFTWKQFLYLAGGSALCYILWQLLPTAIALLCVGGIGLLCFALAFQTINGLPFIRILESFLRFHLKTKLYIWKKPLVKKEFLFTGSESGIPVATAQKAITSQKLHDIAWNLDILDIRAREKQLSGFGEK